jgi:hypothetical protein
LLADGLRALAYVATGGRPLPSAVGVAHPAHWPATAADALRAALSRVPEWSRSPVPLISDVAAALTALQANPGLPENGIIAVCDFGGSGTSITLVDAAVDHRPVGATVRHTDFSGEMIDQALLNHVVDDLNAGGSLSGISAIGSLAPLRGRCRTAKEQLSTNTVTELTVDLPGFHGGVWVTRAELDEAIRQPLDGLLDVVQETLGRNEIPVAGLAAVAAVGGGANIQAVITGLSERLGVTVISAPRPQLTTAIGAALGISRSAAGNGETAAAAAATPSAPIVDDATGPEAPAPIAESSENPAEAASPEAPEPEEAPPEVESPAASSPEGPAPLVGPPAAVAWSPADSSAEPMPVGAGAYPGPAEPAPTFASWQPAAEPDPFPTQAGRARLTRNRLLLWVLLGISMLAAAAGVAAMILARHAPSDDPSLPATTSEVAATSESATTSVWPAREESAPPEYPSYPEVPETLEPSEVP